jgi:hypothetical protein
VALAACCLPLPRAKPPATCRQWHWRHAACRCHVPSHLRPAASGIGGMLPASKPRMPCLQARPHAGDANGGRGLPAMAQAARATCRLGRGCRHPQHVLFDKIFGRGSFLAFHSRRWSDASKIRKYPIQGLGQECFDMHTNLNEVSAQQSNQPVFRFLLPRAWLGFMRATNRTQENECQMHIEVYHVSRRACDARPVTGDARRETWPERLRHHDGR